MCVLSSENIFTSFERGALLAWSSAWLSTRSAWLHLYPRTRISNWSLFTCVLWLKRRSSGLWQIMFHWAVRLPSPWCWEFLSCKAKFSRIMALLDQIMSLCPLCVCFLIFRILILMDIMNSFWKCYWIQMAVPHEMDCHLRGQRETGKTSEDNDKYLG